MHRRPPPLGAHHRRRHARTDLRPLRAQLLRRLGPSRRQLAREHFAPLHFLGRRRSRRHLLNAIAGRRLRDDRRMPHAEAPSREVLSAFGFGGQPVPVGGGRGMTWRLGTVMVKPGVDPTYQEWLATLTGIEQRGFRLAEPLPARDGRWVVQGWGAHRVLSGTAPSGPEASWESVLGAARVPRGSRVDAAACVPR